jgi:hypothetical protein
MATCYGVFLGVGATLVVASIPLLVVGTQKRKAYLEWRKDHPFIEQMGFVPVRGGLTVGWHTEF